MTEPKFEVGDILRRKVDYKIKRIVTKVTNDGYLVNKLSFEDEFDLSYWYTHENYEIDPLENSPLSKALR